jgi:hypothetical protein
MANRTVVANISLSLDGRVSGPGGEYDMGWIVPHAISNAARDHMIAVTSPATTALLGKKNYQGFGGYWPSVADNESADPRDRAFSRWLNAVEKVAQHHGLSRGRRRWGHPVRRSAGIVVGSPAEHAHRDRGALPALRSRPQVGVSKNEPGFNPGHRAGGRVGFP